jgi:dGTPase
MDDLFTPRELYEIFEVGRLSNGAMPSSRDPGRARPESPDPIRTPFQVDLDRIVASKAFRRLKHKTQVLLFAGAGDHCRTRLTHTLAVSRVARTVARALQLNEDLTEAIAMGHDIGHCAFGHMGESVLNRLAIEHGIEGFHHSSHGVRVVEVLENGGKGLNLSLPVRMGILQHTKGQRDARKTFAMRPMTLEGWVVRLADLVAYVTHDLEDAVTAGILFPEDVPETARKVLGAPDGAAMTARMVENMVRNSSSEQICMGGKTLNAVEELRRFLNTRVYQSPRVVRESERVQNLLEFCFRAVYEKPEIIPNVSAEQSNGLGQPERARLAIDFLAGMSDDYAVRFFQDLSLPQPPIATPMPFR